MYINQTDSTNNWLKLHSDCDVVWTTWQTAGRGQAGNSWESERGKNILLSLRLRKPNVAVSSQFLLTMAISLAVQDVVAKQLPDLLVTIKWPNDIYVGNDKICGILIENTIANGTIEESIVGIGLNVNQTTWLSGAPNPVSLKQLTKQEYNLQSICNKLCESIHQYLLLLKKPDTLKKQYIAHLFRFGTKSLYVKRKVNLTPSRIVQGETPDAFEATIIDITEQGELVLTTDDGIQTFHFKQIQFVL